MDACRSSWRIVHVDETESTNTLARSGSPGDVFTAGFQTAGRGRLDHVWVSGRGMNLTMSAVLDASGAEAQEVATLPLAVGLAVAEALRPAAGPLSLKWPNDVLAGGRKIAGILCERRGDSIIAGIGVNVKETRFPPEIAARATSLALLGCDASVESVRDAVLSALGRVAAEWRAGGFAAIYPRIAAIDFLKGRIVSVRQGDRGEAEVSGVCGGIGRNGALIVEGEPVWSGEAHVELGF